MLTRSEYMGDSSNLHHEYYSQFVTPFTIAFIESRIGIKRLLNSKDEHLNDVCKWEQGGRTWLWDRTPVNEHLCRELGEGLSMSTRTCVGKAAAKQLIQQYKDQTNADNNN